MIHFGLRHTMHNLVEFNVYLEKRNIRSVCFHSFFRLFVRSRRYLITRIRTMKPGGRSSALTLQSEGLGNDPSTYSDCGFPSFSLSRQASANIVLTNYALADFFPISSPSPYPGPSHLMAIKKILSYNKKIEQNIILHPSQINLIKTQKK